MSGPSGKDAAQDITGDKICVEAVLSRHAQKLLSVFRLHDLALFAANLQDYELVGWLRKERYAHFLAVTDVSSTGLSCWLVLVLSEINCICSRMPLSEFKNKYVLHSCLREDEPVCRKCGVCRDVSSLMEF